MELDENVRHREDVLQVVSQIDGVRHFRDVLLLAGNSVRYVEFDGGHDFAKWRQTLPDALRWALAKQGFQMDRYCEVGPGTSRNAGDRP